MKQLFNETVQKLRLLFFGYLDVISEENSRLLNNNQFLRKMKNKNVQKWFLETNLLKEKMRNIVLVEAPCLRTSCVYMYT